MKRSSAKRARASRADKDRRGAGGGVGRRSRWLLASALVGGGLVWVGATTEVGGRTASGLFADLGGEAAVREGWAWVRGRALAASATMGRWAEARFIETRAGFVKWCDQWVFGWFESDPPPSQTEASSPPARTVRSVAVPPPASSARASSPGGALEVKALAEAAPSGAPSPLGKTRTRVDPRIAPEDRAALDAKLSRALGR